MNMYVNVVKEIYNQVGCQMQNISVDVESKNYWGMTFLFNNQNICFRKAKITSKKQGQFVAVSKRVLDGQTRPYNNHDNIDVLVIHVEVEGSIGQFIFTKNVCNKYGIFSTGTEQGKRGLRIHPPWDLVDNKQAKKTQKWQSDHFILFNENTDIVRKKIKLLINKKQF